MMGICGCKDKKEYIDKLYDENTKLQAKCERYEKALDDIADGNGDGCKDCAYNTKVAKKALEYVFEHKKNIDK